MYIHIHTHAFIDDIIIRSLDESDFSQFFGNPPPAGHVSVVRLLMRQPGVMEATCGGALSRCPIVPWPFQ